MVAVNTPITRFVPRVITTNNACGGDTWPMFDTDPFIFTHQPPRIPGRGAVTVQMDYGGQTLTGTADCYTRNVDGSVTFENVIPRTVGIQWPSNTTTGAITLTNTTVNICRITIRPGGAVTLGANEWTNVHYYDYSGYKPPKRVPHRRPALINHRGELARGEHRGRQWDNAAPEELVALQLLRGLVGPDEFRRYLKQGFVSVKGPSGLVYQIGRRELIKVWDKDALVATLCVHLKGWHDKPPTDEVVAKMLIAEMDEPDLWKRSNKRFRNVDRARPKLKLLGVAA